MGGRRSAGLGLLAAVVLLGLNLRTVVASLPPLLDAIRADLGMSGTAAGLLTALPVLCFGVFAPIVPRLVRRVAIERLLAGCSLVAAAALALRGAGGAAGLFAGTLLAGSAVAIAQSAIPVLIRTGHAARVGQLTGAFSMALPLGATLGAALAVPLERALGSWEGSLAGWSLLAAVAALAWLPRGAHTRVSGPVAQPLRRDRLAWAVSLYFAIQSMAFYVGLSWLPSILADAGYSDETAGFLLALSALVSLLPAFLVPLLAARRAGQEPILVVIVAVSAASVLGLIMADGAVSLWMVLLGIGQGGALGLALILPVLRGGEPAAVASLTAMMLSIGYLTAALGPWVAGVLHDASGGGWDATLAFLLAVTALQLVPGLPASRDRSLQQAR